MVDRKLVASMLILLASISGLAAAGASGNGSTAAGPLAEVVVNTRAVQFLPVVAGYAYTLSVGGPAGFFFKQTYPDHRQLVFGLTENHGQVLPDGSYTYELHVILAAPPPGLVRDDTRLQPERPVEEPAVQTGAFLVQDGQFLPSSPADQEGFGMLDQVIADDLIVQGSACIGLDCVNNESFSFDTIRLKENNLRIKFEDTSASAGFPSNDWQLTANDSASGGLNQFSIEDVTNSKVPFKVEAGARTNSLYIDDGGRIGLGTSVPVLDLHLLRGNTPAVRFEQDGTSGFTPQTWDVAGNEANFFVRDVTGGSRLPFRIQPGAPTNTLTLRADGRVGIGTWSPAYMLNIVTTGTAANFAIEQSGGARGIISADSSHVFIGAKSNHDFRLVANDSAKMTILPSGNVGIGNNTPAHPLHMASGAHCTAGGIWTNASSIKLKENIHSLPAGEALKALLALKPVTFNYKADSTESCVGFIAEEVPELVATNDRSSLSPMDIVAVLTKVVQEQQKTIQEQSRIIEEIKNELKEIKKRQ